MMNMCICRTESLGSTPETNTPYVNYTPKKKNKPRERWGTRTGPEPVGVARPVLTIRAVFLETPGKSLSPQTFSL